tara:strand:+ start:1937 stop:2374 length:438 start_codon:yes stop_codon:yes gene_type:complete
MEGDFSLDLDEALKNIEIAEVISVYFPMLRKSLLVDIRTSFEETPIIRIVPMALSVEERSRSLKKMRPSLDRPQSITVLPWPKYINSLVDLGIWDMILNRLVDSGDSKLLKRSKLILEELYDLELKELATVISGDSYHTIWSRST